MLCLHQLISVEQKDALKTERGPTSTDPERLLISDTESQRPAGHLSCHKGQDRPTCVIQSILPE